VHWDEIFTALEQNNQATLNVLSHSKELVVPEPPVYYWRWSPKEIDSVLRLTIFQSISKHAHPSDRILIFLNKLRRTLIDARTQLLLQETDQEGEQERDQEVNRKSFLELQKH
jgi:hypothetical protein